MSRNFFPAPPFVGFTRAEGRELKRERERKQGQRCGSSLAFPIAGNRDPGVWLGCGLVA